MKYGKKSNPSAYDEQHSLLRVLALDEVFTVPARGWVFPCSNAIAANSLELCVCSRCVLVQKRRARREAEWGLQLVAAQQIQLTRCSPT